jgi:hypothetical protein
MGRLGNYGIMLRLQYKRTRQIDDQNEANRVARQTVEIAPRDHSDLVSWLDALANVLDYRYEEMWEMDDLEEAIQVSTEATKAEPATPLVRIRASTVAVGLLIKRGDFQAGYALAIEAIGLLQVIHNQSLTLQDQQFVVSHISGLATQACSLSLEAGQSTFKAVASLESGRGVILSILIDDRSDTSKLKEAHPAWFARYETLRLEVNAPVSRLSAQTTDRREPISVRRPKALEELNKCIQEISCLPGFASFQQPLTEQQMKDASKKGNIIIVNITDIRSDAIVVTSSGIRLIPLYRCVALLAQD